jgi:uncharacterized membrane protein
VNLTIAIGSTIILGLFYSWTSRINAMFFFGRTVADELKPSAEGRSITRKYMISIAAATAASALLGSIAVRAGGRAFLPLSAVMECLLFVFIFARANTRTANLLLEHPEWTRATSSVRETSLVAEPSYWIPTVGAMLLPALIAAVSFVAALLFAGHGAGLVAGWASFTSVTDGQGYSGILGLATGMMSAAIGTLILFRTSARLRTRMAQYTVRACIAMEWIATVLLLATLVCSASGLVISRLVMKSVLLLAIAIAFLLMLWNQARLKRFVPPAVEIGADERWRWGLFYVDGNDPALFVQSRCGAGYTLNYGRVAAWPISIGLIAYFVGTLLLLPPHSH